VSVIRYYIYVLEHPITGEVRYVGVNHTRTPRVYDHIRKSKKGTSHLHCWVRSLLKEGLRPVYRPVYYGYGEGFNTEITWISFFRRLGARLVNSTDGGEGTLGWNPPPEWRDARAEITKRIHTGSKRSAEVCKRLSDIQKIRYQQEQEAGFVRVMPPKSPETLVKMAAAQRGKSASDETRQKMRLIRAHCSEETREKLRAATLSRPIEERQKWARNQKGKPKSLEHREKLSKAKLGKPRSEETKQKLSEANRGKKQSEETIAKRAEACRLAWQHKQVSLPKEWYRECPFCRDILTYSSRQSYLNAKRRVDNPCRSCSKKRKQ